jgi:hypothetical protein
LNYRINFLIFKIDMEFLALYRNSKESYGA